MPDGSAPLPVTRQATGGAGHVRGDRRPPAGLRRLLSRFVRDYVHGLKRHERYLMDPVHGRSPSLRPAARRWPAGSGPRSMTAPRAFSFQGIERVLPDSRGWHHQPWGQDWIGQLHRFDDLNAVDAEQRRDWHRALVLNWAVANGPGRGPGWEAPSLAPRIVNWIKWDLRSGGLASETTRRSLVVQVRYLRHFFSRQWRDGPRPDIAKALIFAGSYFADGRESRAWLRKGMRALGTLAPTDLSTEDLRDLALLSLVYPDLHPPHGHR